MRRQYYLFAVIISCCILIRNLLDNAIRYSPEHSIIDLTLDTNSISITNPGNNIVLENLKHLREHFSGRQNKKAVVAN